MHKIALPLLLAMLVALPVAAQAQSNEFNPNTYTCGEFNADIQVSSPTLGYAMLWAFGWLDRAQGQPTPVTDQRIADLTMTIVPQCQNNPNQTFLSVINSLSGTGK
ncbi:MAG: hypothetical protein D6E12_17890 [Desulfovibrio sp.]|nr:MAG: hypothetical protein D6E12_17890 [Desulfovibrio sp.]